VTSFRSDPPKEVIARVPARVRHPRRGASGLRTGGSDSVICFSSAQLKLNVYNKSTYAFVIFRADPVARFLPWIHLLYLALRPCGWVRRHTCGTH
jgi:hypothetical protein